METVTVGSVQEAYNLGYEDGYKTAQTHVVSTRYVQERTCKDVTRHGGYGFECSECRWEAYEPNDYGNDVHFDFEYCPGCGAKVINGKDFDVPTSAKVVG